MKVSVIVFLALFQLVVPSATADSSLDGISSSSGESNPSIHHDESMDTTVTATTVVAALRGGRSQQSPDDKETTLSLSSSSSSSVFETGGSIAVAKTMKYDNMDDGNFAARTTTTPVKDGHVPPPFEGNKQNSQHAVRATQEVGVESVCSFPTFDALIQETQNAATLGMECAANIMRVQEFVDAADDIVDQTVQIRDKARTVGNALNTFLGNFRLVKVFASKVPKLGTVLSRLGGIAEDIQMGVHSLGNKTERIINAIDNPLDMANTALSVAFWDARLSSLYYASISGAYAGARTCSLGNNCLFEDSLESYAQGAAITEIQGTAERFATCNTILSALQFPSISFNFPDLGFFDGLREFLEEVNMWFMEVIERFVANATHFLCCDNVGRLFKDLAQGIASIVDLATCWVDGAIDAISDISIVNELLEPIHDILGSFNNFADYVNDQISEIGDLTVSYPNITGPSISFNDDTCQLSTTTFSLDINVFTFKLPSIPRISYTNTGGNSFSFGSIGDSIRASCSEAFETLSGSGDDEVDCCDIARTCDPEDRVVLYEGNRCTQNIAGTLQFKDAQYFEHRATSATCTANDEARSVRIHGPAKAGWRFLASDNPNRFVTDDYIAITLLEDIPEGQSVCIETFEPTPTTPRSSNGFDFDLAYTRFNGLDGRTSLYALDASTSEEYSTFVTLGERFTRPFSEEDGGISELNPLGPVTGLSCSGNNCDNKQLLKGFSSRCAPANSFTPARDFLNTGTTVFGFFFEDPRPDLFSTDYVSEEQGAAHCPTGTYVTAFECRGSRCDDIRLLCVRPNSNCVIFRHLRVDATARAGATRASKCPPGQVLTGINCLGSFCSDVQMICSVIRRI